MLVKLYTNIILPFCVLLESQEKYPIPRSKDVMAKDFAMNFIQINKHK